ncbi:siderophore-interacting protein [Salipiger sp.]|uniref:siderophore-interacting protein n=1 Tax=Salipiger sp. TaxID=2078585 RepID=UPI003A96A2BE
MAETTTFTDTGDIPRTRRVRHELRRRTLSVTAVERITPVMIRVTLGGEDLADFASAGADDHLKLILPGADGEEQRRDYTPRRFDTARRELVIDLVDHVGGPAADWARGLSAGDTVSIAGPRGSRVVEGDIPDWLLIGDETALPAIGRRIEELPAGTRVTSLVAVPGAQDEQSFETAAAHTARWIHRPLSQADAAAPLLEALADLTVPPRCLVWIAAEAAVARALREALMERGVPKVWMQASGYWISGVADASVKAMED